MNGPDRMRAAMVAVAVDVVDHHGRRLHQLEGASIVVVDAAAIEYRVVDYSGWRGGGTAQLESGTTTTEHKHMRKA
jgi:hypothetical protein